MSLTAANAFPLQKEQIRTEEDEVPANEVMPKFEAGNLHSGSKKGHVVKYRKQALAIYLDEKSKAEKGDKEYQLSGDKTMEDHIQQAAARRRKAK